MAKRIGILTSGGDCPGLNAAIRGVAKAAYELFDAEIIGIADGYRGLIEGESRLMKQSEFSGILTLGGTILGTSRQSNNNMRNLDEYMESMASRMVENYRKMKLDCIVTLGGNGTHMSADMLSQEGLNVIGLPKTIDNDIWGTEMCFGFQTAVDTATDAIDKLHTTATSHGRVMLIELMGNKAGWLNLHAGVAGGADIILIPEIPYDIEKIVEAIEKREKRGKEFSIIAVAEGSMNKREAGMDKQEFKEHRADMPYFSISHRIADDITRLCGAETRVVIPGHILRGGSPCPYDRVLSTRLGVYAAELIRKGDFGKSVAVIDGKIGANRLSDVAGKTKFVPQDAEIVRAARDIGVSFGD